MIAMKTNYKDSNGNIIKVGDIISYDISYGGSEGFPVQYFLVLNCEECKNLYINSRIEKLSYIVRTESLTINIYRQISNEN